MHPVFLILMLALAQTGPQVTVTTDRSSYAPGDQVQITVCASGLGNDTLSLWLYVDKPDLHNLYFAELPISGGVVDVSLPEDAPGGLYTVSVTWGHQIVETSFTVVIQSQTQTTSTAVATSVMSSSAGQTESTSSTSMESASEPPNPWPAFAFILLVSVFSVLLALVLAKWIKR